MGKGWDWRAGKGVTNSDGVDMANAMTCTRENIIAINSLGIVNILIKNEIQVILTHSESVYKMEDKVPLALGPEEHIVRLAAELKHAFRSATHSAATKWRL